MARHSADLVSLAAGVVFAVVGGLLLADRLELVAQARWMGPLLLILLALAILVSAAPRRRRGGDAGADRSEP